MLLAFKRRLRFWFVFNSYLSERLHKYDGCEVDMNIRQNSENLISKKCFNSFDFNNFICIISLYIIILKFVQIPWPDSHMDNLECFYLVLTTFILLHKNIRLLKKRT